MSIIFSIVFLTPATGGKTKCLIEVLCRKVIFADFQENFFYALLASLTGNGLEQEACDTAAPGIKPDCDGEYFTLTGGVAYQDKSQRFIVVS